MANVTYTFTAGTKAQAGQVNKNFQDCVNGINQNASEIAQNSSDISSLQSSKANKNGSSSERFSVANPTSQYEAVNKSYLENAITPVLDYINGLIITKSSNTEIAISAGSCYDSTQKEILALSSSYTASYSGTLSASTTYDVFIRKSKSTSSVDCAILAHEATPSSSDYYYRKIGEVFTDGSGNISITTNYSNSLEEYPNYTHGIPLTNGTTYTASQEGIVSIKGQRGGSVGLQLEIYVDGTLISQYFDSNNDPKGAVLWAYVAKGQTYKVICNTTPDYSYFYPMKGA